jgi:hypothetical protein
MLRMGNLELSQISCNGAFAMSAQKRTQMISKENKAKARADVAFLTLLERLREDIARMDRDIANMDQDLRDKYGDDYIADAAIDILGELPDRLPDENDADYEERLVDLYGDEMVDENGDLKDKWKDHPDQRIRDIANGVKLDYDLDKAQNHVNNLESEDPALIKATTNELEKTDNYQAAMTTRNAFEKGSDNQIKADNASDKGSDNGISDNYTHTDISGFSIS